MIETRATQTAPAVFQIPLRGTPNAPIMVLCDPPSLEAVRSSLPMDQACLNLFANHARECGFGREDFLFVGLCGPIPEWAEKSAKLKWEQVTPHIPTVQRLIQEHNPKVVVTLGELASRAIVGRAVKITKARGVPLPGAEGRIVLPFLSATFVNRIPDHVTAFRADMGTLARIKAADYHLDKVISTEVDYQYLLDLTELLENRPRVISVDTEGTGLTWHDPTVKLITVQITSRPGMSRIIPVDPEWWNKWGPETPLTPALRTKIVGQLKTLLEDPSVRKMGHNLKFDHMMLRKLGIEVKGWLNDTQLMAFAVDENMLTKNLDDCVRIFVPEMSGYADAFNQSIDKSRMIDVPPEDVVAADGHVIQYGMRMYAGGDSDSTYRLAKALDPELKRDKRQLNCYRRIMMPALLTFANVVERFGVKVNQDKLRSYGQEVLSWTEAEYDELIRRVPAKVKRNYIAANNAAGMSFTRSEFVKDILFTKDGFGLKPVVFTPATEKLPAAQRIPSVSTKDHLPFFIDRGDEAGEFVRRLIEYQKAVKLYGTYIGNHNEGTGFWKYIAPNGKIYPSYKLHATNTGRSASDNPNGQNFPKRGRFAKGYTKIFEASPGYTIVGADLSQIELRIAAWMSMDLTMLRIYQEDGDIHAATAAAVAHYDPGVFEAGRRDDRLLIDLANQFPGSGTYLQQLNPGARQTAKVKDFFNLLRFRAKAVNFGFLYGMSAKKFKTYAKTDYEIDYTDAEAEETRNLYFRTYRSLEPWHTGMRAFVKQRGYVRALHGALRHMPSIYSTDKKIVAATERQAINAPVQRFGSDLGLMAMIRFSQQADPRIMRIIGFVHDALIMEVAHGHEMDAAKALVWTMENPPLEEWFGLTAPLPIRAEAEMGQNFGETEELKGLRAEKPEWWIDDWQAANERFEMYQAYVSEAPVVRARVRYQA